jgi:hypothetical protein
MPTILSALIKIPPWIIKLFIRVEKIECIFWALRRCDKLRITPKDVPEDFDSIYAFALFDLSKSATKEQINYFRDKHVQEQFHKHRNNSPDEMLHAQIRVAQTVAVRDRLQCNDANFAELIIKFSQILIQRAYDSLPMGYARAFQGNKLAALQKKTEAESEGTRIPNIIKSEQVQEQCSKLRNCYERRETSAKSLGELGKIEAWVSEHKPALSNQNLFDLYFEMAELAKHIALEASDEERLLYFGRAEQFAFIAKGYENEVEE